MMNLQHVNGMNLTVCFIRIINLGLSLFIIVILVICLLFTILKLLYSHRYHICGNAKDQGPRSNFWIEGAEC